MALTERQKEDLKGVDVEKEYRKRHGVVAWIWWMVLVVFEWQILVRGFWGIKRITLGLDQEGRIEQYIIGTIVLVLLALIPVWWSRLRNRKQQWLDKHDDGAGGAK